jgi:hypothetical protein
MCHDEIITRKARWGLHAIPSLGIIAGEDNHLGSQRSENMTLANRMIILAAALLSFVATASAGTPVYLEESPAKWRLQQYEPNTPAIYFTGSSCPAGGLQFAATATTEDKDRLWSLVLSAKSYNRKVFVIYDPSGCVMSSFGLN